MTPKKKHQLTKQERRAERKRRKAQQEAQEMAFAREVSQHLFDWERMENRCLTSIEDYVKMAQRMPSATVVDADTNNPYIFIDNGAKILGVAHLDTHGISKHFAAINVEGVPWVMCSTLDDRLGVFLLLDVLPKLGLHFDVLLTTGEESGRSSAKKFVAPEGKEWNWMFECDRTKDDVVRYQYDDKEWEEMLKEAGFGPIGRGSFTDICDLGNLGIAGFNMGVGYEDYHGPWAKANMLSCGKQVMRLCRFFELYAETKVPWSARPKAEAVSYPRGQGVNGYGGEDWYTRQNYRGSEAFSRGDRVLIVEPHEHAGHVAEVTSTYSTRVWHGTGGSRKFTEQWWVKMKNPKNPGVEMFFGVPEDCLLPWNDPDVPTTPDTAAPEEAAPVVATEKLILPERELAIVRHEMDMRPNHPLHVSDVVHRLRKKCEGDLANQLTWQARWDYELWLFPDDGLKEYSSSLAVGADVFQSFQYNDEVYTPDGRGVVSCTSPMIVRGYEDLYWVRLDNADRGGFHQQLYPDSELTKVSSSPVSMPKLEAPSLSTTDPAPLITLSSVEVNDNSGGTSHVA